MFYLTNWLRLLVYLYYCTERYTQAIKDYQHRHYNIGSLLYRNMSFIYIFFAVIFSFCKVWVQMGLIFNKNPYFTLDLLLQLAMAKPYLPAKFSPIFYPPAFFFSCSLLCKQRKNQIKTPHPQLSTQTQHKHNSSKVSIYLLSLSRFSISTPTILQYEVSHHRFLMLFIISMSLSIFY